MGGDRFGMNDGWFIPLKMIAGGWWLLMNCNWPKNGVSAAVRYENSGAQSGWEVVITKAEPSGGPIEILTMKVEGRRLRN